MSGWKQTQQGYSRTFCGVTLRVWLHHANGWMVAVSGCGYRRISQQPMRKLTAHEALADAIPAACKMISDEIKTRHNADMSHGMLDASLDALNKELR